MPSPCRPNNGPACREMRIMDFMKQPSDNLDKNN
jgi:hypothetical protein